MRILAIDPGEKRIGLAVSDPGGVIASPLGVILHSSLLEDLSKIEAVISEKQIDAVVIGESPGLDGEDNSSTRRARKLGEHIHARIGIRVEYVDESGTTNEAINTAFFLGKPKKKRSGHQDSIAATLILQRYLETMSATNKNNG